MTRRRTSSRSWSVPRLAAQPATAPVHRSVSTRLRSSRVRSSVSRTTRRARSSVSSPRVRAARVCGRSSTSAVEALTRNRPRAGDSRRARPSWQPTTGSTAGPRRVGRSVERSASNRARSRPAKTAVTLAWAAAAAALSASSASTWARQSAVRDGAVPAPRSARLAASAESSGVDQDGSAAPAAAAWHSTSGSIMCSRIVATADRHVSRDRRPPGIHRSRGQRCWTAQ